MSSPQFWAEVKLRLSSIWLPLISIMLHPRCCSSKVCFSRNAEQLSLRGSETRFCELQMMMTREEQSNTCCCLQEVMWLLFFSYSCRDGDGDGSFCSKVNYRANICSITSPMRPKRGWKDPLHSTNVNRYVTIIFTKLWRQSLCYKVNRNSTLIFRQIATFVLSFANNRRILHCEKPIFSVNSHRIFWFL